eukprot:363712-Chlamydomonas_euryale.AAC.9
MPPRQVVHSRSRGGSKHEFGLLCACGCGHGQSITGAMAYVPSHRADAAGPQMLLGKCNMLCTAHLQSAFLCLGAAWRRGNMTMHYVKHGREEHDRGHDVIEANTLC